MSSSKIINFTVLGRRRIVYKVTASYDAPTDEVKQACMDAVLAFPAVLKEPTPTVYLSNYGASSIEYTIRCWTAQTPTGTLILRCTSAAQHLCKAQRGDVLRSSEHPRRAGETE